MQIRFGTERNISGNFLLSDIFYYFCGIITY